MNNHATIIDVSEDTFQDDVIERSYEQTVVVDFWAPWCGPCRMLGPMLERLANDPASDFVLAKLNVDENPSISMQYRVQGIPAVKAFRNGSVVDEFVGAQPEGQVRDFIKRVAPGKEDRLLDKVEELLRDLEWVEAEASLRQASAGPAADFSLAKALLGQGKGCEAKALLEDIVEPTHYADVQRLLPLADFLCEFSGDATGDGDEVIEAQYRHAATLIRRNNIEAALDGLLEVLRQDKQYRNGQTREVVVALFTLLGDDNPLTRRYRSELAMILF